MRWNPSQSQAAGARLKIHCQKVLEDMTEGASIAVNGVCLTAVDCGPESFSADLAPETLRASNLGALRAAFARQSGAAAQAGRPPQRTHRARSRGCDRRILIARRIG